VIISVASAVLFVRLGAFSLSGFKDFSGNLAVKLVRSQPAAPNTQSFDAGLRMQFHEP
jgi:hypothetical protein